MTLTISFLAVFVAAVVGIGGGIVIGQKRARAAALRDVQSLEAVVEESVRALQSAKVDQAIVTAIRAGELGVAELREAGFEDVRETTGASTEVRALLSTAQQTEALGLPGDFTPLPYRRDVGNIEDIAPRDQVWIQLSDLHHNGAGEPVLWYGAPCSPSSTGYFRTRVRCLNDGSLEVAVDPDDPGTASSTIDHSNALPVLRVIPLET